jgi:uncharacterized protein YbjQ (UPF0145 family)
MITPKEVLVLTTSSIEGIKIKKYLKPISSHVVAGTNVFSDFAASFTDFFGGRSESYQKQLSSLYNEAIERIKIAAFEIGANCVVGLKVDLDEISGKGKAMFMITVVGTAIIIDDSYQQSTITIDEKSENVSIDKIIGLHKKKELIRASSAQSWQIDDDTWDFIIQNQVEELFPTLLKKMDNLRNQMRVEEANIFYKRIVTYINNFPENKRNDLLYLALLKEKDEHLIKDISKMINDLQLLDLKFIYNVLVNDEFENQKKALQVLSYQNHFYNREDVDDFGKIKSLIQTKFNERGTRSTKKQLLSSKEKEVWVCECGQANDIGLPGGDYCIKCNKDIYGFKKEQINPIKAANLIDYRIELITHFLK